MPVLRQEPQRAFERDSKNPIVAFHTRLNRQEPEFGDSIELVILFTPLAVAIGFVEYILYRRGDGEFGLPIGSLEFSLQ